MEEKKREAVARAAEYRKKQRDCLLRGARDPMLILHERDNAMVRGSFSDFQRHKVKYQSVGKTKDAKQVA